MPKKVDYTYLYKTGRPTKFKPEYTAELIKFFNIKPTKKEIIEETTEFDSQGGQKKTSYKYKHVPNTYPTLLKFAMKIKVNYATLRRWAESGEDPGLEEKMKGLKSVNKGYSSDDMALIRNLREFCESYKMAKALQEEFLVTNGLNGASPSSAFIFTAKNRTTMRDKVESEVTFKEVKPLLENLKVTNVHNHNRDEEGGESKKAD